MNAEYAGLMTGFPLFEGYTRQGAEFVLATGEVREHESGEVLCREGDPATFVLLVLKGTVQIFIERQGRTLVLREVGPGTILGELGELCRIPRTAGLRASDRLVVLHWSTEAFRRMLLGNEFLSQRIMQQSLRMLHKGDQARIDSLSQSR